MLHLFLGTAGTGKTTLLLDRIRRSAQEGAVLLLVPEQFSFESEKRLARLLGPKQALEVEVLSFTRLCDSIFRRFGGLSGESVNKAAKCLLMSVAVEELRDSLTLYRKSCANVSFLETLTTACAEFQAAGLSPENLAGFSASCATRPLRDKARELSLLYGGYEALLSRSYLDPDDDLRRALAVLDGGEDFFSGYTVFVDGFSTFTAGEWRMLSHILARAKEVFVALTADSPDDGQNGMGVFSPVKSTVRRLLRTARGHGVEADVPVKLEEPRRYRKESLAHLSREFLSPAAAVFEPEPEGIRLVEAGDPYKEAEAAAAAILSLVREEGYRYREIVVVLREPGPYRRALEMMLRRYDIPFFLDMREQVENKLLPGGVLCAVDTVRSNFDTDSVLQFAKSPLLGLGAEEVAGLENYCTLWGVRGASWKEDFTFHPRGLAGELTEDDRATLEQLNTVRRAVIEPLREFALGFSGGAPGFARGIYRLLESCRASEHLAAYAQTLEPGERESFLDQSAQLWDILMETLDLFGSVLGHVRLPAARLCELFRLALSASEIAQVPQTLDQVTVGSAGRIRPGEVRAAFVLGANEGVFPAAEPSAGVFTDEERRLLMDAGLELSPPALQKAVLEKYFAYFALTRPSEKLWVSYPRSDLLGREMQPSVIVTQLLEIFPALRCQKGIPELELSAGEKSALLLFSRHCGTGSALEAALRAHLAVCRGEALERMDRAARKPPHQLRHAQEARKLFGDRMRISPTRVERYYRCPFSYFAADALRLRPRKKVEFSPLESGGVIHNLLQVMVQRHGGAGLRELPEQQLRDEVAQVMEEYLSVWAEDKESLPVRFRYLFSRLSGLIVRLLRRLGEEFSQSDYRPVAFELPIDLEEGVEPLHLVAADGTPVVVEGMVDRVDVMDKNGRRYLRVVDYKSGKKSFRLSDVLYGLNLQMLLYLFTLAEHGTGEMAGAIPAGVLYMPVQERFVSSSRGADGAQVEMARRKEWRMSGLLLEDEDSLRGMERDLAGVFIPAKLARDGTVDKKTLADKAEMGALARKVKELVADMALSLGKGHIASLPAEGEDYETCKYCDYRAVCGFEEGDPVRLIAQMDREEFFKQLEKEEEADV